MGHIYTAGGGRGSRGVARRLSQQRAVGLAACSVWGLLLTTASCWAAPLCILLFDASSGAARWIHGVTQRNPSLYHPNPLLVVLIHHAGIYEIF